MPPLKIQPIDIDSQAPRETAVRTDAAKPVLKSRLKRLFDRQFPSVLRISSAEKPSGGEATQYGNKDGGAEFEPSSVCLAKMVQSFIEQESNEKQSSAAAKCGRNRCNCFNGNNNDMSDDEFDMLAGCGGESVTSGSFGGDAFDVLKSLSACASVTERNLLADVARVVEKNNKILKGKDDLRKTVTDALSSLGYDSAICKSKWDKSASYPAGEYEYIDVIVEGERLLIDIDFRSEFEIARSTGTYKAILQSLPYIFVGKPDRLGQIISIVSEAAKQSLKRKGMHFPPWRKAEYMRAKWLSSYTRNPRSDTDLGTDNEGKEEKSSMTADCNCGELELIFGEKAASSGDNSQSSPPPPSPSNNTGESEEVKEVKPTWQPPAVKPKSVERGAKVVTGLASLLKEKP